MKRHTLALTSALLTFIVGVSAAAAWVARPHMPTPTLNDAPPSQQLLPQQGANTRTLEMVFVLDTTGSMSGLLAGAKQRIWGIVNEVMQMPAHPAVRIGLVAYRDRGDSYVTQVLPLTSDLDQVYTTLMDYEANGGGDTPEDVRRALAEAIHRAGWSEDSSTIAQILFLVGDAPPHDDYMDEPSTEVTVAEAARRGMVVNTIQCGDIQGTREVWQAIAQRGEGRYFAIAQDGGVETITTPYDERLSQLGTKLGSTFVAYGGGAGTEGESTRIAARARQAAAETQIAMNAPRAAAADRAVNKVLNREAYQGDLLQSIENGAVKLDAMKAEDLPDELRQLAPEARQQEIERRLADRRALRAEITALARQRDAFLTAERRRRAGKAGVQNSFDLAVSYALKQQLARKGIK